MDPGYRRLACAVMLQATEIALGHRQPQDGEGTREGAIAWWRDPDRAVVFTELAGYDYASALEKLERALGDGVPASRAPQRAQRAPWNMELVDKRRAEGHTWHDIATECGTSLSTLYRWWSRTKKRQKELLS